MKDKLLEIKTKSINENVPIIFDDTAQFLLDLLASYKPKTGLEIGTATGYSAFVMLQDNPQLNLITLEKDEERYKVAKKNLKPFKERVKLVLCDAIDYLKTSNDKFDFIFLDGPKGQYKNYLPYLIKSLNKGGKIVVDNVYFHGMVTGETPVTKGVRSMINHLKEFYADFKASSLKVEEYSLGDGILVGTKEDL